MTSKDKIEREKDRSRGILSASDRKWLLTPRDEYVEEHSRQYWGQRRDEVINRVQNAVLDFTLLFNELQHEELSKIVGQRPTAQTRFDDSKFEAGVRDGLAFLLETSGGSRLLDKHRPEETTAERLLHEAVERIAWKYRFNLKNVSFEVEAERIPMADLIDSLEADEELSNEELAQLLIGSTDEIDTGPLQEVVREQLITDTKNDEDSS